MATSAVATAASGDGSSSAESEALKLAFSYLVNSMDTSSLLPAALSRGIIREKQKADCTSETNPYQKAEIFLDHLQREVNGDNSKFHTFVQLLEDNGHSKLASRLRDELSRVTILIQAAPVVAKSSTEGDFQKEKIIDVSDTLLKELSRLRISYARFLRRYKKELQNSPEAQEELVETLPRIVHRGLGSDCSFGSYFDTLVDEEVSLFNVTYLEQICDIFPQDVCAATEQLVVKYEEQQKHFMSGITLNQFKKLFPVSAVSSKLSSEKSVITLKLKNYWGTSTLEDLKKLVNLFGIPGSRLHLERIDYGSVIVQLLCSTIDAKELKLAIAEATDFLQSKGVLEIFVGEELVLEFSQFNQECRSHEENAFEFVDEPDSDYFCPVCQDLLTDPFQLECGHQLCRKCRDRLISAKKDECPTCRDSNALSNAHFDKFLKRKVSSVKVHCQHHKEGCEWVGEVRDLQYHLDRNIVACPFGCGKHSCQVVIKNHKSLYCLNRPISCKNCDYYNTFAIVTEKHNPICLQSLVDCPNHCPAKGLKRNQLEQHFDECSHQLINCPETGCSVWLSRGEMKLHIRYIYSSMTYY